MTAGPEFLPGAGPARSGAGDHLPIVESALGDYFESRPASASMTFVGVEEIRVQRFDGADGITSYVSLGMSRAPMTALGSDGTGQEAPRAELLVQLRGRPDDVWRRLAVLAAAPTVESAVYRPGMTVDLGESWSGRSRCVGAVVVSWSARPSVETPSGPVELLQLLPATKDELAWSRVHGSIALRELWTDQAVDLLDIERAPVAF